MPTKRSYDMAFKLKVVACAEAESNRRAARYVNYIGVASGGALAPPIIPPMSPHAQRARCNPETKQIVSFPDPTLQWTTRREKGSGTTRVILGLGNDYYITKVHSRSVDPRKLCVGVKYVLAYIKITFCGLRFLAVCARVKGAQKARGTAALLLLLQRLF